MKIEPKEQGQRNMHTGFGTIKVAFMLPALRGGGVEKIIITLAKGLSKRGVKVEFVLAHAKGEFLDFVSPEFHIYFLDAPQRFGLLRCYPSIVHYLLKARPDAIFPLWDGLEIIPLVALGLAKALSLSRLKTCLIYSIHNDPQYLRKLPGVLKRTVSICSAYIVPRFARKVVAVSKGVAEAFAKEFGLPLGKTHVIYNGVVTPELYELAEEPVTHPFLQTSSIPVILAVGRLTEQKDFPTLLRAFALVRKEMDARLLILGEGEKRKELEALARELGIAEDLDMPGFVKNPYKYMRRSAVFVLSSQWEGLPTVLVEAMACGCPVVSTNCPSGPAEILENGKYGLLVPPRDHEKLAQAILQVLKDERLAHELREKGRKRALDFNVENAVEKYLDLINACVYKS